MACWRTHTHMHAHKHSNPTHTYKYGVNEEALDVCIHIKPHSFMHTRLMCRKWGEEALDVKNVSVWMWMHTPEDIQWNHRNTHIHALDVYTLSHNMNMYSLTFRGEYTCSHTLGWHTLYRHTSTHQAAPVTDVGRSIARKKALLFLFFSLSFGMPILVHSVAMSPKLFLSSSSSTMHVSSPFSFPLLCYHHEIEVICAKGD